jgi:hypothetical protein
VSESHLCLQNITCISKSEHNTLEKNWLQAAKQTNFLKGGETFCAFKSQRCSSFHAQPFLLQCLKIGNKLLG